jgi:tetratricopeptide (TPR) repeat protein
MATERWDKIQQIYHSALEQEISHRRAFISQACGEDKSLEQEIISLVEQEGATSFLEEPALEVAAKVLASPEPGACSHPTAIGRYRIIRMLGEGGMGTVYEAEQDEPHRVVALKVIKLGMAGADRVRRFRQERQILAGLAHPGIARLLDGDYTESGAPYLVMEYVDGQPITQWCDERNLNLPARLRLFQKLCDAVEFAHQHLVVHRDLKPANVLVTPEGEPKLLDFGIAKLIDQNADATWTAERALTLDYTSPEQVRGGPITTAADVYALGILLYELIAAKRLYTFSTSPLEEAIDSICTRDPAPPSAIASKSLSEDLDAIVLKAMRKEAQERYPSPRALSDDIERFLTSRPVLARRGTLRYVASKFARRYRLGVSVAAVLLITLCGATASIAWEAHIARLERDRAQRRFNDVRGLADAVIFGLQYKLAKLPGTTEVRKDLVALAINYLDAAAKEGTDDPSLQGELAAAYINVGDIQGNLNTHNVGDLPASLNSYAKAERLARALVARYGSGGAKMLLANALIKQAYGAKYAAHDTATGARKAMEALQIARENAQSDPANPEVQLQVGSALQCAAAFGDSKESLPYLLEEATLFEGLLARDPDSLNRRRNAALAHKYIAGTLNDSGNEDAAFEHLKRAEELDEACVRAAPNDPDHKMDLAIDLSQWGEYYESKKDLAKAIQYTRGALAIRREIVSADPKDSRAKDRLVYILNRLGDLQLNMSARQALASYQEAKSLGERLPPAARSLPLAKSFLGIASSYEKLGDVEHSCPAYAESTKLYRDVVKELPRYSEPAAEAEKGNARCTSANR